ncbi:PD-(D/E)XK nuclease family protein [Nocardioides sp. GY 10113]|uniref:RecB family exonuclease n=1 Tax=Nocardioides sp. GY 10113 TaxID=2569761 RepID=UPI0010A7EFE6|nr:PD-(D/E)XK nuclease family protein [Nocardioides sp. GY 10113]TIC87689.1 PD-(D/E)XK nuclease family protein [Nocardioides sp. GY 10113]
MAGELVADGAVDVEGAVPADSVAVAEVAEALDVVGSLSPSRAGDFLACPLLYRFRTVDKLPERTSPDAARGTLVHKVLEDLFDLPADDRTPASAEAMLEPTWASLVAADPDLADLFPEEGEAVAGWMVSCREVLARYFRLEDPRRLEPAERELYLETVTGSRLQLRGIIDRVDVAPDGSVRVVDYKTGRSPREGGEARALFQLKFYGLLLWRLRGVVPRRLQLMYLGNGEIVHYEPDEQDLLATERKVEALWRAIELARTTGDWRPSRGPLCAWCDHQALCPAWGGTPPPLPEPASALDRSVNG